MSIRSPATGTFVQGVQQSVAVTPSTYYLIQFYNSGNDRPQAVSYDLITDGGTVRTYSDFSDSIKVWITPATTSLKITVQTLDITTFTNANPNIPPATKAAIINSVAENVYATITITN